MRALLLSLLLLVAALAAAAPVATAGEPCVAGVEDDCIVQFVVCVTTPCPPRLNLPYEACLFGADVSCELLPGEPCVIGIDPSCLVYVPCQSPDGGGKCYP